MFKKMYFYFTFILFILSLNTAYGQEKNLINQNIKSNSEIYQLYNRLNLGGELDFEAFKIGYLGFKNLNPKNPILTIVDFSQPSTAERFFVINLDKNELLFKTHVSHGRNSGEKYATKFSNRMNSYQSSPGFYKTNETYYGGNGYSLRLDGLEKGINDRARDRAIVVHGADYANPNTIVSQGRLGRSLGCPALPQNVARPIIDTIKNRSVMYIHVSKESNPEYREQSHFTQNLLSYI